MPDVRAERTNWRDEEISARHREWGWDCPAVDLDFLMVEFNHGKPVALVEYKRYTAQLPEPKHIGRSPTYKALGALAKASALPFFIATYWPSVWAFRVWPLNKPAADVFPPKINGDWPIITEREYVGHLYRLRNSYSDKWIAGAELNDTLPKEEAA
jgi:hypothetical protein